MKEDTLERVERVMEKLVDESPVEKVLLMDNSGGLVRSYPHESGDVDTANLAFDIARKCISSAHDLGVGAPTKVEIGSKGHSLLMIGVDKKYLVALRSKGKIDEYMLLANLIKLFHEYELGTRVTTIASTLPQI